VKNRRPIIPLRWAKTAGEEVSLGIERIFLTPGGRQVRLAGFHNPPFEMLLSR